MMGFCDVHIASATMSSGMEAHIDGVDQATAEGLKAYLLAGASAPSSSPQSPGSGERIRIESRRHGGPQCGEQNHHSRPDALGRQ